MLGGSFTIQNDLDVATLSCYTAVNGNIDIDAPGVTTISLPNLGAVGGSIQLAGNGAPNLVTLDLPALTYVGGGLTLHANTVQFSTSNLASLATLNVPVLGTAGALDIAAPITAISLPSLSVAPAGIAILAPVTSVSAPLLVTQSFVTIDNSPAGSAVMNVSLPAFNGGGLSLTGNLGTLNVGSLATAKYVLITSAVPASVTFPALTTVTGGTQIWGVFLKGPLQVSMPLLTSIQGGSGLELAADPHPVTALNLPLLATVSGPVAIVASSLATLSLPSLTSVDAGIPISGLALYIGDSPATCTTGGNPLLTTLDLPNLTTVGPSNDGGLMFVSDPMLPLCRIQSFVAQLHAAGWTGFVTQTNACTSASGPCP